MVMKCYNGWWLVVVVAGSQGLACSSGEGSVFTERFGPEGHFDGALLVG